MRDVQAIEIWLIGLVEALAAAINGKLQLPSHVRHQMSLNRSWSAAATLFSCRPAVAPGLLIWTIPGIKSIDAKLQSALQAAVTSLPQQLKGFTSKSAQVPVPAHAQDCGSGASSIPSQQHGCRRRET